MYETIFPQHNVARIQQKHIERCLGFQLSRPGMQSDIVSITVRER